MMGVLTAPHPRISISGHIGYAERGFAAFEVIERQVAACPVTNRDADCVVHCGQRLPGHQHETCPQSMNSRRFDPANCTGMSRHETPSSRKYAATESDPAEVDALRARVSKAAGRAVEHRRSRLGRWAP